jgi:hypothetical protein
MRHKLELKFKQEYPIRPMTQVAVTLIPTPPCRYLSHPLSPNHVLGLFLTPNRICDLIHSIETAAVDNRNRDGDTLIPPTPKIVVSATLCPGMPSAGAFFSRSANSDIACIDLSSKLEVAALRCACYAARHE